MLNVVFRIQHKFLQGHGRVFLALLHAFQDGVVKQSSNLDLPAPRLVGDLHLELHNLVRPHEVVTRLVLLPKVLVQEVQQAHHGLVVLDHQVEGRVVFSVDGDGLPRVVNVVKVETVASGLLNIQDRLL